VSFEIEDTEIYKKSNLSRETFRLLLGLFFSLVGLFFCLGSGFQNIVFADSYVGLLLIFSALAQPVFFLWHRDFGEVTSLIYQHTGETMRQDMIFVIKYMSTSVLAVLLLVSLPITVNRLFM
jgi:SNF family Na+-dependent transporter